MAGTEDTSAGVTKSERYLSALCRQSFLSLWSYPNLFRDQGKSSNKGDGKEICDLTVFFGDDVVLFSDRRCQWNDRVQIETAWSRWYRAAVWECAQQLHGAERWIRDFPHRVFVDRACSTRLPIAVPTGAGVRFHRIVVASGAGAACRAHFGDPRGSLVFAPSEPPALRLPKGERATPFFVGDLDVSRGFVHILDEESLNIVVQELDTISDFVSYLIAKEEFVRSGRLMSAAGEEEILGYYLRHRYLSPQRAFSTFPPSTQVVLDAGHWDNLVQNPQWKARKKADEISFLWDGVIELITSHLRAGTLRSSGGGEEGAVEPALRAMASKTRFERRCLSESLKDVIEARPKESNPYVRTLLPRKGDGDAHVLVCVPRRGESDDEYRKFRRTYLAQYAEIVSANHPQCKRVIGVATESGWGPPRSFDILAMSDINWTEESRRKVLELQRELGLFLPERVHARRVRPMEFPDLARLVPGRSASGKVGRNAPCPCGSGWKYKKCHGRSH